MKPAKVITELPVTKNEINDLFLAAKKSIMDGDTSPLKFAVQIKALEELVKALRADKDIRDCIISEVELYGKDADYQGNNISVRETGVKYDFAVCGSSKYNEVMSQIESLTEKKKEIEKFLKVVPDGGMADPETGELISKPVKSSTTSPVIKLK